MDSGLIRKREKAKRYAEQRERIHVKSILVTFDGDNNPHTVKYNDDAWQCDCDFFQTRQTCSHTMAIEMIMEGCSWTG
jgi:SWIM zinc finger